MVFPHKIIHYSNGDYYKVKYRNHFCYRCGTPLTTIEDSKVVNSNAENAKYYNFPSKLPEQMDRFTETSNLFTTSFIAKNAD